MHNINNNPVKLLQNLIRFDTSNPPGNESECIKYLNEIFTNAGFETQILAKDSNRSNLITRLKGQGNTNPLLLYGHVDVVPVKNQEWKYPPFEAKIAEGYLWGRGTLDMKGGVAMMVSALLKAKAENLTPPGDVICAIVSDEEAGGTYGAKYLVESHPDIFKGVKYAVGEFGGFTLYVKKKKFYPIMVAEKRPCRIKIIIRGPSGHGALPMHGGATAKAGAILSKLDKYNMPVHITDIVRMQIDTMASNLEFPENLVSRLLKIPALTDRVLKLLGNNAEVFEPLLHNTVNVVNISGGEQLFGIPSKIEITLVAVLLPGYKLDDIISELGKVIGDFEFEILRDESLPYKLDMGLFDTLKEIIHKFDPAGIAVPILLTSPTDARTFDKLGIQTYGFTPMILHEEMNFTKIVHSADERIPVEAIDFGTNCIYELLKNFK
ncbi:MAG: M20/M25/M40 family metallo-hydrolase [Actinobacteria bacterium]|nr:M20/M25/M40 family metallo-hydrolase [Actinomycetota bacterium]MBM3713603.1 M20/M25/M40 family metallo-hydrolase [Actinomycetota bacterium]